jgi:hypothetical protein
MCAAWVQNLLVQYHLIQLNCDIYHLVLLVTILVGSCVLSTCTSAHCEPISRLSVDPHVQSTQ